MMRFNRNWKHKANVAEIVCEAQDAEELTGEKAVAIAKAIVARLRESLPEHWFNLNDINCDETLIDIVTNLEAISVDDDEYPAETLDDCLEALYEWGDAERVWLSA